MATITFSVKLDEEKDAELIAWLTAVENRSQEIKAALYHYRNLPPPPTKEDAPITPAPAIDLDLLRDIIDYAVDRGAEKIGEKVAAKLGERLEAISITVPLNGKRKKKEVEKPKIDGNRMFEEAMGGLDSW